MYKSVGSPFLTEKKCSTFQRNFGLTIITMLKKNNSIGQIKSKYFKYSFLLINIKYNSMILIIYFLHTTKKQQNVTLY